MLNESVFGEAPEAEAEPRVKMLWPPRIVNQIEGELHHMMGLEMSLESWRAPTIFIEEGEFENADQYAELYGEPLTVHEAVALQAAVFGPIQEHYRRAIIVARELGERPTFARYLLGCEVEGIDPILKKGSLT